MFWIFLLFIALMALGCYVTYKEAKHHELHKMRACFIDIEKHIEQLKHTKDAEDDPYTMEVFRGEIIGIEKALTEINKEDADCDLIQEIEDDLVKIKEKIAGFFGN
jgi:soluble cytochrome b562